MRWIRDHRDGLMLRGAVLAGIVIALYELALARLGHEPEGAEAA